MTQDRKPTVVVTGAKGGIGTALCSAFKEAGYRVIGCDMREGNPGCDVFVQFDICAVTRSEEERASVLRQIHSALDGDGLTALVNNAAIQILGSTDDLSMAQWRTTLDTNLLAPFFLAQGLLPDLERGKGSVVNIASIHAALTKPGFAAYATSKAALVGLTRSMAVDLGKRVRVNAIVPGATATPMLLAGFDGRPAELAQLGSIHPLGRIGSPDEIAAVAVFLASPSASFMTGIALAVDGGIGGRLHDPI